MYVKYMACIDGKMKNIVWSSSQYFWNWFNYISIVLWSLKIKLNLALIIILSHLKLNKMKFFFDRKYNCNDKFRNP